MKSVEFWLRCIRLPFVVGLAVAGYLGLVQISKGSGHAFFIGMLIPFTVVFTLLECIQLADALRKNKQS